MLDGLKSYVYDRRSTITKVAGVAGGLYLVRRYVGDRVQEAKDKYEEDQLARDNLKRRFHQTQEDIAYTILALLPSLSSQILDEMNVEELTQELQSLSKARHPLAAAASQRLLQHTRPPSSLASSIMIEPRHHDSDGDERSDVASVISVASTTFSAVGSSVSGGAGAEMSTSGLQSWVETSGSGEDQERGRAVTLTTDSPQNERLRRGLDWRSPSSNMRGESDSVNGSGLSDSIQSLASDMSSSRSKGELWKEIKMLTFTRTLTTLYSITLLSLLTSIQLTLLARSRYINAVLELEREERVRERFEANFSIVNLLVGRLTGRGGLEGLLRGDDLDEEEGLDNSSLEWVKSMSGDLGDEVQNKFLTMSWWMLHVGWKGVGERVRRAVEEVFEGVSLKTKLSEQDLHRLISDVRRRVEYEITFEGTERRTNFLSTLLPSTPETTQHVLTQGGFTSPHRSYADADASTSTSSLIPSPTPSSSHLSQLFEFSSAPLSNPQSQSQFPLAGRHPLPPPPPPPPPRTTPGIPMPVSRSHSQSRSQSQRTESGDDLDASQYLLHQSTRSQQQQSQPQPQQQQQQQQHSPLGPEDPAFFALLDETREVVRSADFARVLEVALDRATDILTEGIGREVFGNRHSNSNEPKGTTTTTTTTGGGESAAPPVLEVPGMEKRVMLAGLLPGLARWSRLAMEGLPNELVDDLLASREVSCLCAIVFARFEDEFIN